MLHEYAERYSWQRFSSHPACKHQRTRKEEQRGERVSSEVANNVSFRLLWTLHLRHGQHDGRHVGQFTCQTQREDFRNARGAEIHTHDTCTGNMHTSDLLVNNCSVNTASHLWSVLHRLRVFHCSWATKMWLLRRWVWDSTEVIKYLSNATIEASVTSVA